MWILVWLVTGIVAGLVAVALHRDHDRGDVLVSVLLGVVGAFAGGFVALATGINAGVDTFDSDGLVLAAGGALIVIALAHALERAESSARRSRRGWG